LNYVGAWVQHGQLVVNGDVGNYAGMSVGDTAQLAIRGNVGSHVGYGAYGYSGTVVYGNAGDFAGCAMRGNAHLDIGGSAGDYCGYALSSKEASVNVRGEAGAHVGYRARYGTILVKGFADSIARSDEFRGVIQVGGVGRRR
jgi:formylmethanofuran dehydrogenase subunit C